MPKDGGQVVIERGEIEGARGPGGQGGGATDRRARLVGLRLRALAARAFALLLALRALTEAEDIHPPDFAADALELAPVVATAVFTALLSVEARGHVRERLVPLAELDLVRCHGATWRARRAPRRDRGAVDGLGDDGGRA